MTDPLTHPGQLCAAGDRAVDLALELGQARARPARYEAQETRIRALLTRWEMEAQADGEAAASAAATPPMRTRMHALSDAAREHRGQLLAALDEPEAPT